MLPVRQPWWQPSAWRLAFIGAVTAFLATAAFLLVYREVNLDEGWYLWAARLVYEGRIPYRDFAYPQAPLLPYVYGLFRPVWGQGLYQGRLTTFLFAAWGLVIGYKLARARGGPWAGVLFLWLQTTTLVAAAYTVAYTAPYALASALLLLAFHQGLDTVHEDRHNILATLAMVAAAATRLSAAAGLAVFLPYLVYRSRDRRRALVLVALTTAVAGVLFFGPFLALSGRVMLYDVFGFHTDRMIPEDWPRVRLRSLLDTLHDFGAPFSLVLMGLIGGIVALARSRTRRVLLRAHLPELVIGLTALALFVAHLLPRTTMSFYHSLQMPLVAVLGSLTMVKLGAGLWRQERLRPLLAVLVVLFLAVHAGWQFRRVLAYELVRWPPRPHIAVVQAAARAIESLVPPGSPILTFATPLVVETDLRLLPGYEMSIFAYRPTWSTAEARRYRVVNNELLQEALAQPQPVVALTTYDLDHLFYGERESILATLYRHYRWVQTVPAFGPLDHELRVFLPPRYAWQPAHRLERRFEDGIRLLGYDLSPTVVRAGETLSYALYWQAEAPIPVSYTVFTQLLDAEGRYVTGWDNPPCHGTCPTTTWQPGEIIRDEYRLPLPADLPAGTYALQAGWYEPETGRRLLAGDGDERREDRVILATIVVR